MPLFVNNYDHLRLSLEIVFLTSVFLYQSTSAKVTTYDSISIIMNIIIRSARHASSGVAMQGYKNNSDILYD